mmetsp:Transcript_89647/g.237142  ORF Transcript_89647/g.237142 Transcript_89647/m.237142 type:complete len:348 (-) Transcript_89647:1319-2362(-)
MRPSRLVNKVLGYPRESASLRRFRSRLEPDGATVLVGVRVDGASEDEAEDGRQLHDDVERGAGRVLQGVTHRVSGHGVLVRVGALGVDLAGLLVLQQASRDVLLRVVPGATGVAHGDGQLHAGHQSAREEPRARVLAEADAGHQRAENYQEARGDHLLEGRLGGDPDALLVVGLRVHWRAHGRHDLRELRHALLVHLVRRLAHGLHRHGRERVRDHGAEQEAGEDPRVQDVHGVDLGTLAEGGEQGQAHERGRADGEAFADGRGGVPSGVKAIRLRADLLGQPAHLGDAACVVGDGAVGVDGEGHGHSAQHTQRAERHAEHAAEGVSDEDGDPQAEHRDDARQVAER